MFLRNLNQSDRRGSQPGRTYFPLLNALLNPGNAASGPSAFNQHVQNNCNPRFAGYPHRAGISMTPQGQIIQSSQRFLANPIQSMTPQNQARSIQSNPATGFSGTRHQWNWQEARPQHPTQQRQQHLPPVYETGESYAAFQNDTASSYPESQLANTSATRSSLYQIGDHNKQIIHNHYYNGQTSNTSEDLTYPSD